MTAKLATSSDSIFYPESDGKPIAENTLQFDWITMLVGELRIMYLSRADLFVAGDLFWYPVQGIPGIVQAPDAMVAMGRPKGFRPSYKHWEEGGIAPQVIFEVLSPSNDGEQMERKREFYERYGVEEYYVIDPFENTVAGFLRRGQRLAAIAKMNGWKSPRLGVSFHIDENELLLRSPTGTRFQYQEDRVKEFLEERERRDQEMLAEREMAERQLRSVQETAGRQLRSVQETAEQQLKSAQEAAERQLEAERQRREAFAKKLRELGIDPDSIQ